MAFRIIFSFYKLSTEGIGVLYEPPGLPGQWPTMLDLKVVDL
jgi:hypothetical protein